MAIRITVRQDNSFSWSSANPVLAAGEFGYEQDTALLKVGDGVTAWNSLKYIGAISYVPTSAITAKGQIITGSLLDDYETLSIGAPGTILVQEDLAFFLTYVALNLGPSFSDIQSLTSDSLPHFLYRTSSTTWNRSSFETLLNFSNNSTYVRDVVLSKIGSAGYILRENQYAGHLIFKWSFPTDSIATVNVPSGYNPFQPAGFGNPSVAGYFSVGNLDLNVYKWAFPAETAATTTSAPAGMVYHAGFSNPSIAGYFSRGNSTANVYKWTFPADTVSQPTAAPATMANHAGFANPAVAGYFSRGAPSGFLSTTTVYKWTFPADAVTTATTSPGLMAFHAGFANPAVAGYFSEGNGTTTKTAVYKWSFPTDSVSTTTSALAASEWNAGFANPSVAGYFSRSNGTSTIYKWSFPTDSVSTTTPALSIMSAHSASFANS